MQYIRIQTQKQLYIFKRHHKIEAAALSLDIRQTNPK